MTDKERAAMTAMIYESIRFSLWAAGEGICPAPGENAVAPEDFLFEYANAVDVDDWDGLDVYVRDVFRDAVGAPGSNAASSQPADSAGAKTGGSK